MPSVFCQPVSIGGPRGSGLDFPVWPLLVPAADGFQVCYTDDEDFRDTYLERGFCGLDAAIRDQFDHDCHRQAGYVAPTVKEEKPGKSKQTSRDRVNQQRKSRTSPNDQEGGSLLQTMFEPFPIFGYFSLPAPRIFMNTMHLVRPYMDKLVESVVTFFEVTCYISLFAAPAITLFMLALVCIVGAIAWSLEILWLSVPDTPNRPSRRKRISATAQKSPTEPTTTIATTTTTAARTAQTTTSPIPRPGVAATASAASTTAASDPGVGTPTHRAAKANDQNAREHNDPNGYEDTFEMVPKMPLAKATGARILADSDSDGTGVATIETWRRRRLEQKSQRQQQQEQQQQQRLRRNTIRVFGPDRSPHDLDRRDSDEEDEDEDDNDDDDDDDDDTTGRATPPPSSWGSCAAEA